jgi:hypothetical protein
MRTADWTRVTVHGLAASVALHVLLPWLLIAAGLFRGPHDQGRAGAVERIYVHHFVWVCVAELAAGFAFAFFVLRPKCRPLVAGQPRPAADAGG